MPRINDRAKYVRLYNRLILSTTATPAETVLSGFYLHVGNFL